MVFFIDWGTQYQYFLVFAGLFVVIFTVGHIRNFQERRRIHRHLREHGMLAETNPLTREEQIRQMGRDQLFGINQLLYGHYTDGVHVVYSSFNNTPVSSLPGSRNPSRPPSPTGSREASGSGPGPSSAAFRESLLRERLEPLGAERQVESYSPEPRSSSRPPPAARSAAARKYTPSMPSRLSQAYDASDMGLMSTIQGAQNDESDQRVSEDLSHKTSDSSGKSGSTGQTSIEMVNDDSITTMRTNSASDLQHLSNHRMSHVAETGQFPRRKAAVAPTQQIEKNRQATYRALTTDSDDEEEAVVPTRPRPTPRPSGTSEASLSPSRLNPLRGPFDTPETSRAPSMMMLDDVTPTEELQVPLLEFTAPTPERSGIVPVRTYSPIPRITQPEQRPASPNTYSPRPISRSQTDPSTAAAFFTVVEPEAVHPHDKRESAFEHPRDSVGYRRVNANFEVSRAGKKMDMNEALELGEMGMNPHSEFEWDEDMRQSKKLQKKKPNRASTDKPERPSISSDRRRSSWFNPFGHPSRRSTAL